MSDTDPFILIRRFRDLPDALLAKSVLDSADLNCFLFDENLVRLDWLWSNLLGGVKLCVPREQAQEAAALLDQQIPEEFSIDGEQPFEQPRCPNCGSLDVSFEELFTRLAYASIFIGIPLPVKRHGWNCHSCSYEWL